IERTHLERLYRRIGAGERRQQNELSAKVVRSQMAKQIDTRHVGHADIRNNQVELDRFHQLERFLAVLRSASLKAFLLQEDLQQLANRSLVINNKDFG